jgi:hypothetical protein
MHDYNLTEKLPITIDVCDYLNQQFSKINSICNKLEAQFNFQTMRANWYSDEDNVLCVRLFVETPKSYDIHIKSQLEHSIHNYSDDVFRFYRSNEDKHELNCYIAITDIELSLLDKKNEILSALLNIKLKKVINLIAKDLKLNEI